MALRDPSPEEQEVMARTFSSIPDKEKIGRIVYRFGQPRKLGVVLRLDRGLQAAEVLWLAESRKMMVALLALQDFQSLVLEAERKAENHRESYSKALVQAGKVVLNGNGSDLRPQVSTDE